MFKSQKGFTAIEAMIVVVIIMILAAVTIPNFIAMANRVKEDSTKSSMHTVQLAAEDYSVQNDGCYPKAASDVVPLLPRGERLKNAFTGASTEPTNGSTPGSVIYVGASDGAGYTVYGIGAHGDTLALVLRSGQ